MKFSISYLVCLAGISLPAWAYLNKLPDAFVDIPATWGWISYRQPSVAVIPGSFNRSILDAPWDSETSDSDLSKSNTYLNTTDFVAYDPRFFDIIGPNAIVEHVQHLAYQSHEASCYNKKTKQLFFVEWGPPGGDNGVHQWQYLLDTRSNSLRKITTNPPTSNIHGCVIYRDEMFVVTDGDETETGFLAKVDSDSWNVTKLLNNYYQQPFLGFNDLEIDSEGNFWLTDSKSAYGREIIPFYYPANPSVYFVNGTTMRPKVVHITTGNTNGIAVSKSGDGKQFVYIQDTGISEFKPVSQKNPFGNRALMAYDMMDGSGGVLSNARLLNNPITYFYDGLRV